MDLFRTIFSIPPSEKKITYRTQVMFMGSCFSEYIGAKFVDYKFKTDNNPFGIVYNPLSVKSGLTRLIENEPYIKSELLNHQGIWVSFDHHSRFSDADINLTLDLINKRLESSSLFIRKANFLFLTFGTSYVYSLKNSGKIVSNCHKLPASDFIRYRLSVEQIVTEYDLLLHQLFRINPDVTVIFTVSPIRHWKDGAHDNQLSKAILLLAIEQLCKKYKQTLYFPSYELLMDDLRDYRFYEEDMLHPNKIAINYIWNRVRDCFVDSESLHIMKEVEKVLLAVRHRPFNANVEAYQNFIKQTSDKINFLQEQYSINFSEELKLISQYLGNQ